MIDSNKESKYDDILKRPSKYAEEVGSRKPVYLNYTSDGRLKTKPSNRNEYKDSESLK